MSTAGLLATDAFAHQVVEEAAHRRQAALHAARAQAPGVGTRREHAHVLAVDRFQSARLPRSMKSASARRSRA